MDVIAIGAIFSGIGDKYTTRSRQITFRFMDTLALSPWASCQIRKIVGCACAGDAGNVFPANAGYQSRHASGHVCDARAVMHAGIADKRFALKPVEGKTFPAFPAHAQPAILRIWQEAHIKTGFSGMGISIMCRQLRTLATRWSNNNSVVSVWTKVVNIANLQNNVVTCKLFLHYWHYLRRIRSCDVTVM